MSRGSRAPVTKSFLVLGGTRFRGVCSWHCSWVNFPCSRVSHEERQLHRVQRIQQKTVAMQQPSAADFETIRANSAHVKELSNLDAEALQDRIAEAKARDDDVRRQNEELERAQAVAREESDAAAAAGKLAFMARDYAEAERQYDIVLSMSQSPHISRHELLSNRAACCIQLGKFSEAVSDAAEATYMEPTYVKGFYRLACALQCLGKLDRALVAVSSALKLQPAR